jgi:hypothetical protein
MQSEALAAQEELALMLDRLGVPFVVGGSLASGAWGEPRSTHDIDILIRIEASQVNALTQALERVFYVSQSAIEEALRHAMAFNIVHLRSYQKIDLFVAGEDPLDAAQLAHPVLRRLSPDAGGAFPVTAAEVMVLRKLDWFRKGDMVSERQWRDVLSILRVQHARLDYGMLQELARETRLDVLLRRAFDAAFGEGWTPPERG